VGTLQSCACSGWSLLQPSTIAMPDFSFRLPRFLRSPRSRRSHSPQPSPTGSRNDAALSQASYLSPSFALTSRPLSTHGAPKQVDYAATGTSFPLAPRNQTRPQNSTDRLRVERASGDSSGQPTQISRPITPTNAVNANSASKCRLQDSVTRPPLHHLQVLDSTDIIQSQHASYSLAAPSQQSVVLEQQSVRVFCIYCLLTTASTRL
jgi:hypothetical protein